ncbi:vitamin B12 ABC transporter permease BtuC [Halodesulfurarchaeum sp. HSR-GB]|uniref:vitamin B12 ABC transporter permease BtuC n=1 Tax=Halodesulfurarchaeum sp. HSR-GB TaxID=3074077 RepID=UPI0028640525|nr:vitamin B12 ABC transporter permease BtuC [Halodesulfurarchaeum sp. HSR-GB]MDR5656558.1 vitamin B12 ABC transporter permease BtuC [Halodesulfurarchaeum sp. HSR-GB]
MDLRTRTITWIGVLSVLLFATVTASAGIGPVSIAPLAVLKVLLNQLAVPTSLSLEPAAVSLGGLSLPWPAFGYTDVFAFEVSETYRTIVWTVRMPRILLGALVGFALSVAGSVMQGFFRNPMADPSIIGVSSGAAVGAVAAIILPIPIGLRWAAFTTGIISAFGVYLIATEDGRTPVATLLLAGVAVQTFLSAIISFMLTMGGHSLEQAVFWMMGHLHNATWEEVGFAALVIPILFVILAWYSRDLNVLLLGEEDAATLGIEVEQTKRILLGVSSLITAAAVAVSGVIGFVGLIVPHMMRLIVGPDHRILLPTSALAGAAFLVATDTIARTGAGEIPVGIVTSALGAPFFLFLLRRREVHSL